MRATFSLLMAPGLLAVTLANAAPLVSLEPTSILKRGTDGPVGIVFVNVHETLPQDTRLRMVDDQGLVLFDGSPRHHRTGARWAVDVPSVSESRPVSLSVYLDGAGQPVAHADMPPVDTGWVMHFIPGFHYDPVWWNTQAHYTETGHLMGSGVGPGLALVEAYLEKNLADPDYKVALHQLPYLKTFVESRPDQVETLLDGVMNGRVSITGGTYNELSTTLISAEATLRNAIYGSLFQRGILGGTGDIWWQCDVFGHDPSFPGLMAACGHEAGAFGRGPFHQWGAPRDKVNIDSEFMWMSPDGRAILTHYMTGHYGYGYDRLAASLNRAPDAPEQSAAMIAGMFEDLKRTALTHHVLLPMHMDFIRPLENLGEVVRAWNKAYLSPEARISLPEDFFREVRREIEARDIRVKIQTRDMNPVYTGCGVSYADLKVANRAAEAALRDAEILATLARANGAPYPSLAIDRAWRQLLFNAHHDAVTGSMSDQVYLDVLAIYREALETAVSVRDTALNRLHAAIVPNGKATRLAWNTSPAPIRTIVDTGTGQAAELPAIGFADLDSSENQQKASGTRRNATTLENEYLIAVADPEKGGALVSLIDKRSRREILNGPSNHLVRHREYPALPGHGEGPWHLAPTGEREGALDTTALIDEASSDREIAFQADHGEFTVTTRYELRPGEAVLRMTTEIDRWTATDTLLRAEFSLDYPNARPLHQTASAIIARPFARDVDTAEDAWTLDQAFGDWAGLGTVCHLNLQTIAGVSRKQAFGVAAIEIPADAETREVDGANDLARALVQAGVTSTISRADQRRYGDLEYDSNRPDILFRIDYQEGRPFGYREAGGDEHLPVVQLRNAQAIIWAVNSIRGQFGLELPLDDEMDDGAPDTWVDGGAVLASHGPNSVQILPEGKVSLNLLRSCTSWPAGVWIDGPQRRLPNGKAFQTMFGSHVFSYALIPYAEPFRDANVSETARRYLRQPHVTSGQGEGADDERPASRSFLKIEPAGVDLLAMKPAGFAEASWRIPSSPSTIDTCRRVALRVWNGSARPVDAKIHFALLAGRAWRGTPDERPDDELTVRGRTIFLPMAANAVETLLCEVTFPDVEARDPLDPVASRPAVSSYWLENLGEGVTGNGILSVTPTRRVVVLEDGSAEAEFLVSNNHVTESVEVELVVEHGPDLSAECREPRLVLAPSSYRRVRLAITARNSGAEHRSFVSVRAKSTYPWKVLSGVWVCTDEACNPWGDAVEIVPDVPVVGASGSLTLTIRNLTDGPLPGVLHLISPPVTWKALGPWRNDITLEPRGSARVSVELDGAPVSWIVPRFTTAGTVAYGPTVAVVEDPSRVLARFLDDRARVRPRSATEVSLRAVSLSGLNAEAGWTWAVPQGWHAREVSRTCMDDDCRAQWLRIGVSADDEAVPGDLVAHGPQGATATLSLRVVPVQKAKPLGAAVAIDGVLDEWADDEFTTARSELGEVRAAVRYDGESLVMAFRAEDEVQFQDQLGASIWQGDSCQFGLSSTPSKSVGYRDDDYEYGAALTREGPVVWCWIAGTDGKTGKVDGSKIEVTREGNVTNYELRIPNASLPRGLRERDRALGFSYIVNDNDGEGFRGAIQWTPGLSGAKDPSLFGELEFEP